MYVAEISSDRGWPTIRRHSSLCTLFLLFQGEKQVNVIPIQYSTLPYLSPPHQTAPPNGRPPRFRNHQLCNFPQLHAEPPHISSQSPMIICVSMPALYWSACAECDPSHRYALLIWNKVPSRVAECGNHRYRSSHHPPGQPMVDSSEKKSCGVPTIGWIPR